MKLSKKQIDFYSENGYLIIEEMFSPSEIEKVREEIGQFENRENAPNIVCEDNGDIRSIFAPHHSSQLFERLYKDTRLVTPSEQLVGEKVCLYQYKLNLKKAFRGDCWEWHQDFPFWHFDDNIPHPDMTSAMILLQETRSFQGCLMAVPTSHKVGLAPFQDKESLMTKLKTDQKDENSLQHSLNNNLKYTVAQDLVKEMANKHGIVNLEGKIGTCIFFHPNLFHASNTNISPFERDTAIVTYNSIKNTATATTKQRPDYICSRDLSEVVVSTEDLLQIQ